MNKPSDFEKGEKRIAFLGSGGCSGIKVMLEKIQEGVMTATVGLLASNTPEKGLNLIAEEFGLSEKVKHILGLPRREKEGDFAGKYSPESILIIQQIYSFLISNNKIEYVFLSGYLQIVLGIDWNKIVNIHPGPVQEGYGGEGMHGDAVHEKIFVDYKSGKINQTCVTMHYATDIFDDERFIIAQVPVSLSGCENAGDIQKRVNKMEHEVQWRIYQLIIDEKITWTGDKDDAVQVSEDININDFPEGTVFGEPIDLQKGLPYKTFQRQKKFWTQY